MASRLKDLLPSVIAQLAGNMAAGPLAGVLGTLATAGVAAIAPIQLAQCAGYLALFLGTAFIQDCRARKTTAQQQLHLKQLESAIRQSDRELLAVLASQQRWIQEAIEQGPDAFNAAWSTRTRQLLEAADATPQSIADALQNLTVIGFDTNWRIRGLQTVIADVAGAADRIESSQHALLTGQQSVIDEQQRMAAAIEQIAAQISAGRPDGDSLSRLQSENADLRAQVLAVTKRYIKAEKDKGQPWRQAIEQLRHDPRLLGEFLDVETDREDREHADRHRERAAVWYTLGEIDKALTSLMKILSLFPDDLDATNRLGHIRRLRGDIEEATRLYTRVGKLAANDADLAASYGNLGLIEQTRGNLEAAEAYHKKALEFSEKLGSQEGMAIQYGNLGVIEQTRGNLEAAEAYHKKALAINEKLGRQEGMAAAYSNLGAIEQTRGNLEAAEAYHKKALAINEKLGRQEGMAIQYGNLGLIERTRGNLEAAEEYLKKALAINEKLGSQEGMAIQYGNLGLNEQTRGNPGEARRLLTLSRDLFQTIGARDRQKLVQSWIDRLE